MSTFLTLVIFIALSTVPADVDEFKIVPPSGKIVDGEIEGDLFRLSEKESGGWQAVYVGEGKLGTFSLEDKRMKWVLSKSMKKEINKKRLVMPMGRMIDFPKNMNWSEVKELQLKRDGKMTLSRKEEQITVDVHKENPNIDKQSFIIRWKEDTRE